MNVDDDPHGSVSVTRHHSALPKWGDSNGSNFSVEWRPSDSPALWNVTEKVTVFWPGVAFAKITDGDALALSPLPVMTRLACVMMVTSGLVSASLLAALGSVVPVEVTLTCALGVPSGVEAATVTCTV